MKCREKITTNNRHLQRARQKRKTANNRHLKLARQKSKTADNRHISERVRKGKQSEKRKKRKCLIYENRPTSTSMTNKNEITKAKEGSRKKQMVRGREKRLTRYEPASDEIGQTCTPGSQHSRSMKFRRCCAAVSEILRKTSLDKAETAR